LRNQISDASLKLDSCNKIDYRIRLFRRNEMPRNKILSALNFESA